MRRSNLIILIIGGLAALFLLFSQAYLSGLANSGKGRDLVPLEKELERQLGMRIQPSIKGRLIKQGKVLVIEVRSSNHQDRSLAPKVGRITWDICREWEKVESVRVEVTDPDTSTSTHDLPRPQPPTGKTGKGKGKGKGKKEGGK